jgi:hypothetical protein
MPFYLQLMEERVGTLLGFRDKIFLSFTNFAKRLLDFVDAFHLYDKEFLQ